MTTVMIVTAGRNDFDRCRKSSMPKMSAEQSSKPDKSKTGSSGSRGGRKTVSELRAVAACRGREQILLVDDDVTVRESLTDVLVAEGYQVIPAANGREAVQRATDSMIDLVLLDLNMPVLNGWEAFEQLTRDHPLIPVVIATARPNQLMTALGAGAGALLEKPMDIPILLGAIRQLLDEPAEVRLARLAGRETTFHYSAGKS